MKKKTGYRYHKTNSKGDPVFRRDTDQSLCEVETYLKENDITYEYRFPTTTATLYKILL